MAHQESPYDYSDPQNQHLAHQGHWNDMSGQRAAYESGELFLTTPNIQELDRARASGPLAGDFDRSPLDSLRGHSQYTYRRPEEVAGASQISTGSSQHPSSLQPGLYHDRPSPRNDHTFVLPSPHALSVATPSLASQDAGEPCTLRPATSTRRYPAPTVVDVTDDEDDAGGNDEDFPPLTTLLNTTGSSSTAKGKRDKAKGDHDEGSGKRTGRGGRNPGSRNIQDEEWAKLFELILEKLPMGQHMWNTIAKLFNEWVRSQNAKLEEEGLPPRFTERDETKLRDAYNRILAQRSSTGNPRRPELLEKAKKIDEEVNRKVAMAVVGGKPSIKPELGSTSSSRATLDRKYLAQLNDPKYDVVGDEPNRRRGQAAAMAGAFHKVVGYMSPAAAQERDANRAAGLLQIAQFTELQRENRELRDKVERLHDRLREESAAHQNELHQIRQSHMNEIHQLRQELLRTEMKLERAEMKVDMYRSKAHSRKRSRFSDSDSDSEDSCHHRRRRRHTRGRRTPSPSPVPTRTALSEIDCNSSPLVNTSPQPLVSESAAAAPEKDRSGVIPSRTLTPTTPLNE